MREFWASVILIQSSTQDEYVYGCVYVKPFGSTLGNRAFTSLLKEEQIWRGLWPCGWDLVLSCQYNHQQSLHWGRRGYGTSKEFLASVLASFTHHCRYCYLRDCMELKWVIWNIYIGLQLSYCNASSAHPGKLLFISNCIQSYPSKILFLLKSKFLLK